MGGITSKIQDPSNKNSARVSKQGALCVYEAVAPIEPGGSPNREIYFRSKLTGMDVDGSSTIQEFTFGADSDGDIYITTVVIIIADSGVSHGSFGNIGQLDNGWSLLVDQGGIVTPLIDQAENGGQVIAQSGTLTANNGTGSSYELINWEGNSDATLVPMDMRQFVSYGIRLGRGTKDKFISRIEDNLTGLNEFTLYFQGYKRFP